MTPPTMPDIPRNALNAYPAAFEPSKEWAEWIMDTFIDPYSPLHNKDHEHLVGAHIGVLFTNAARVKKGKYTLGMMQLGEPTGDGWTKALQEVQREAWFTRIPDFIMTIQAQSFFSLDTWSRCALIEHELLHASQAKDEFGSPRFNSSGGPIYSIRAHDVEAFTGEVRRYGAWSDELKEMIASAERGPTLQRVQIDGLCGTCRKTLS